ncbi:sacsin-like [Saccostrea echinata]|uniref:sacsin-like n=1 Tax=Saccostrea echinata TaxID=191078 RepID=UPI002A7F82B9|nr:sacsin-like [Saccostrea echinata]
MIFRLGKWALLPVRRNDQCHHQYEHRLLYPLNKGKCVFDQIDCAVTKTMKAIGLPYLDRTEVMHEDSELSSIIVASSFVATSDDVLEILDCILSNTKNIEIKANCEVLMEYFESKASSFKPDADSKEKLRRLPFYENLLDEYQTLGDSKTSVMLPKETPINGLHQLCLKTTVQFLKHKPWTCVYARAGCDICDVVEVYHKYILPNFSALPERDIVKHMETLKNFVITRMILKSKSEQNSIMELLQQVAFLVQNGIRYTANKFYNPQKKLYYFLCQKDELPPAPFANKDWIHFLKICGLRDKVTEEIFVLFALRVEKIGKEEKLSDKVKKYSSILIETLQNENMFCGNEKFLEEVKKIHFVLPYTLEQDLVRIHSQYAADQLLNFADSELVKNKELVWTKIGLLNENACRIVDDQRIWQRLGHDKKPLEEKVFEHIKQICPQFPEDVLTKVEIDKDLDTTFSSVFRKIYSYLENISCSERIISLKETPFIYVKERKAFASPDILVLNMDDEHEIPPYLYKAPTYFGEFHAVFQKFGASEKLSSNHYVYVLKELYKRSSGGVIDPNERTMTIKAVQLLFEKLRKEISDVQLKSELYLPSKDHILLSSKSLIFVDDKVLEKRLRKGNHNLKYILGFKELGMKDVHDPVKEISLIPTEYRPKLLSKIVTEEVSTECKTYKRKSERAKFLEKFLCCEEFIKSVIRLVRHERYKKDKECGEMEEKQIRDTFKMTVFEVDNLTTVLRLNSEVVKNTEMQTQISYSIDTENSSLVCVYLNSFRRPENTKWIEYIANELTHIINCLLNNELSGSCLHLAHVLGFIENPECIREFLDSKQIISLEDSSSDEPFIPELGSEIPVKLHHLLNNSFKSLEINEYVGYEQFDPLIDDDIVQEDSSPVFLFARVEEDETKEIKNMWEKRFRIDIGLKNGIVVSASRLYKFERKIQRDLRMEVYTQHTGSEKTYTCTSCKSERKNLKEQKRNIKNIMKDTLNKPLDERKRVWKRLLLQYHPDKHMDDKDYYTKLTQYINSLIQRIENGQSLDYESEDEVDSGTGYRGRRKYYRPSGSSFRQEFNFSSFYEHCFNRGKSYAKFERAYRPPEAEHGYFQEFRRRGSQPGQAERWYRQAKYDLDAAQGSEGQRNTHNWVCFKCHQAVEKALKALLYQKDADLFMRTHDLSLLASRCGGDELKSMVLKFEEVTKSYDAMRYPDGVASGSVPSEFYTEEQASNAKIQAQRILKVIKAELEKLKCS